jgi:dephospho-CoA kinase
MIIIGITGTLGAGKGTIVDYLVNEKGFSHFSVRGFITEEIKKRGLEVNRDNMVIVANDLREKHNPAYIAEQLFEQAKVSGNNCVIESLRTIGEVEALKSKGIFYLFAVNADSIIRYNRITNRKSETDNISYETFIENETREMESDDPNKQNLSACIKMADFLFINNGTIEEFNQKIQGVLNEIIKK